MDIDVLQAVLGVIGPLGVLVLAVFWLMLRRRENNGVQHTRNKVLESLDKLDTDMTKLGTDMDNLKTNTSEIRDDVREVRQAVTQHLHDHAGR